MKTMGERIKAERKSLGLTQEELADLIGAGGKSTVSQWETSEEAGLEAGMLLNMSKVFNCSPEWLYYGTGQKKPIYINEDDPVRQELYQIIEQSFAAMDRRNETFTLEDQLEVIKFVMKNRKKSLDPEVLDSVIELITKMKN